MRTADVCPTCATYINALCVIFDGPQLTTLDINPLDSVDVALNKIETWAASIDSIANITDDPYGVSWDGNLGVATKNSIYDKIEDVISTLPEYTLSSITANVFNLLKDGTPVSSIDLSPYLDDRARITSGSVDGGGIVTFTRDDATTFTVDLSTLLNTTINKTSDIVTNDGADGTSTYVEHDEIATVATTGSYNDLSNLPALFSPSTLTADYGVTLSTVATTGSYNDLLNLPTLFSPSTLTADYGVTLSTVATTGSYSDLSGTPTLATVATSGDYNDLLNLPTLYSPEITTPVEFSYQDNTAMIADQANQTANYFEYVRGTDTYYEYLGTTVGDITDYREITDGDVINILRGKSFPAVHIVYANAAAMYADQKKQITGALYRTSDNDIHYEFLGTNNADATDYKAIGAPASLQAVTDVGNVTTNNIDVASINALPLFLQTALSTNNIGIGVSALESNTSTDALAIGNSAAQNNSGSGIFIGRSAARNNSGNVSIGIGAYALESNISPWCLGVGDESLRNNTGNSTIAIGRWAGRNNKGSGSVGVGYGTLESNTGGSVVGVGKSTLAYNTSPYAVAIGETAGMSNSGLNSVFVGYATSRYNQGNNVTAIGHQIQSTFNEDIANAKDVANAATDVDTGQNRITITAHGFGSNGSYINLKYNTTGTNIGGLGNNNYYKFLIVDANTIETFSTNLSSVGTDTHTFTPQFVYDNITVLGANAIPTASNQVTLGDSAIVELVSGNYKFDVGQTLGATEDNYVLTYDDATGQIGLEAAAAGGISDAPSDGTPYARQDASWVSVSAGSDSVAYKEVPSGLVNGVNTVFTMVNTAISIDFIWLYIDGVAHSDFTYNAPTKEITLGFAPTTGSTVEVQYVSSLADPFPDITNHNSLSGLNVGDFVHLTAAEKTNADTAYTHSQSAHAPSDAQKNSDILKSEVEAVLTGEISSHTHDLVDQTGIAQLAPELKATASPTTTNVDWSLGVQFPIPMTADTTLTFSNLVQAKSIMLVVTGNHSLTLPAGVDSSDWLPDFVGTNTNYINIYCVDSVTPVFLTNIISKP